MSGGALREIWVFSGGIGHENLWESIRKYNEKEINFRWKAARNRRIQYSVRTSPRQQHHTPTLIFDFVPFWLVLKSRNKQIIIIAPVLRWHWQHRFNINPGSAFWCAWAIVSRHWSMTAAISFCCSTWTEKRSNQLKANFPWNRSCVTRWNVIRHSGSSPSKSGYRNQTPVVARCSAFCGYRHHQDSWKTTQHFAPSYSLPLSAINTFSSVSTAITLGRSCWGARWIFFQQYTSPSQIRITPESACPGLCWRHPLAISSPGRASSA